MQRWVLSSERDIASSLVSINLDGHFTLSGSRDSELRLSQKMEAFALFLFPLNPSFRSSPWKNCLPPLQPLVLGLRFFWFWGFFGLDDLGFFMVLHWRRNKV